MNEHVPVFPRPCASNRFSFQCWTRWLLSGFTTWGTPHIGLDSWAQPIKTTKSRIFSPLTIFGTWHQASRSHQTWSEDSDAHLSPVDKHVNTVVFTSYHSHSYPRIDNAFNQEVVGLVLSDMGHQCLLLMMAYDIIVR
jgi:hypothetical protein